MNFIDYLNIFYYNRINEKEKDQENQFKIAKETKKALLLQNDQNQTFWIQKRWMRADGSLTSKGLEASKSAKSFDEYKKERKKHNDEIVEFKISWESEKAVALDRYISYASSLKTQRIRVFFPKSLYKAGGVPRWLWNKKMSEIELEHTRGGIRPFFEDDYIFV